ncbi:30S ribosomal protein S7 [Candidatus Riflebacteria bacterium]
MPRRKRAVKRDILPDPIYNSMLVTKFVNRLMLKGKKSLAYSIFYNSLEIAGHKLKKDPLEIFKKAISNARPVVEVKSRRIGGANYQIPIEVREDRSYTLALRWMVNATRKGPGRSIAKRLANELIEAYNNTGETVKKKETVHKMADANKAFAHFRKR